MKVSVVIPVFNAAAYVGRAVESALAQPECGEVLLVEDGSTDDSLAVCEHLAKREGVRLLRHRDGENRGAAESRNLGIENSACPLLAFLDADDLYLQDRFRVAVDILKAHAEVDGVYEIVEVVPETEDARQRMLETGWPAEIRVEKGVSPERLFEAMVRERAGFFHTDGIVVRRSLFERSGLFDPRLRTAQDVHLWVRMAAVGRLVSGGEDRAVARCMVHAANRVTALPRKQFLDDTEKVWKSLLEWGKARDCSADRLRMLARRYLATVHAQIGRRSFFRAIPMAWTVSAVLFRTCPRPWRVPGFARLMASVSGVGLGMERLVDWFRRDSQARGLA